MSRAPLALVAVGLLALLALVALPSCKDEPAPNPPEPSTKTSAAPSSTGGIPVATLVAVASAPPSASASASAAPSTSASGKPDDVGLTCLDGMLVGSDAVTGFAGNPGGIGLGGLGLVGSGTGGAGAGAGGGGGSLMGIGGSDMTTKLAAAVSGHTVDVTPKEATADIGKAICLSYPAIHPCFDAAVDAGPLDGTLELAIEIGAGGAVKSVTRSGGTLTSASLAKCVGGAMSKLTLGKPTTEVKLGYSLKATSHSIVVKKTSDVRMREVSVNVGPGLPADVVRRIARTNFARFRACYNKTLAADPGNKGSVVTKFVIDAGGSVSVASAAGGTNADAGLRACVLGVIRTMAFPAPEPAGTVNVLYGIDFSRAE